MAKVAVVEPMNAKTFAVGRNQSDIMTKRRTPSELRGEQLKRQRCGTYADALLSDLTRGHRKPESLRGPKYIDTRVDEVYTARKFGDKWRVASEKEKAKDSVLSIEKTDRYNQHPTTIKSCGDAKSLISSDDARNSCTSGSAILVGKSINDKTSHNIEKCSRSTFLTVKQLSLGDEMVQGPSNIDMDKALKGLTVRQVIHNSAFSTEFCGKHGVPPSLSSRKFNSEFCLPGHKSPLDFTLKTALRLVSSSSVKWCHRLSASWVYGDAFQSHDAFDVCYTRALNTWRYPQSSLPSSVISAMSFASSQAESSFLLKRQQDWDDSFRSLYYMLRKGFCNIFYVHTTQFVAMFVGGQFLEKKKRSINAYISQSTTGLRSLLREHDVAFAMPLCHSEADQAAEDDLVELSEIENQSLGRELYLDALSDVDSSPQSLLAFIGNHNVHALYDFLLNHRYFSSSQPGVDVPVLYSPMPFQNGSVCIPEVRCKEMKRADAEEGKASGGSMSYSIEIKDAVLPPWVVSGLCAAIGARGSSFQSSFTTEPMSMGLNVALNSICGKSTSSSAADKGTPLPGNTLGFPEAVITPQLYSAFLKELRYANGSYEAHLTSL